jgi:hypothetical protein
LRVEHTAIVVVASTSGATDVDRRGDERTSSAIAIANTKNRANALDDTTQS